MSKEVVSEPPVVDENYTSPEAVQERYRQAYIKKGLDQYEMSHLTEKLKGLGIR